jgi:hypothetical protein
VVAWNALLRTGSEETRVARGAEADIARKLDAYDLDSSAASGVGADALDATATDALLERNIAIGPGDDGIDFDSAATTLTRNLLLRNGDLGIEAVPDIIDGGGNTAPRNGNPAQCLNVACR